MILRYLMVIVVISEVVAHNSDLKKPSLEKIEKMIHSLLLTNNDITSKLLHIEEKIDKLATSVESIQTMISDSDCTVESNKATSTTKPNLQNPTQGPEPTREEENEKSFPCISKPSSPILLKGTTIYVLTEVNERATSYEHAVNRKEFVNVEVEWAEPNDPCAYYNATVYLDDSTTFVWRGNGFDTSASFKIYKGGVYNVKVELCNQHGCSNSWRQVVVADTDGSHYRRKLTPKTGGFVTTSGKVVTAYYNASKEYFNNFTVREIVTGKLTHLIYQSVDICVNLNDAMSLEPYMNTMRTSCKGRDDFKVTIYDMEAAIHPYSESHDIKFDPYKGIFRDLMRHKILNPDLKILVAIGGNRKSMVMWNKQNIEIFVASVKEFLQTWKFFDGVDIDWSNLNYNYDFYVRILKKLRVIMDQLTKEEGKQYELTQVVTRFDLTSMRYLNITQQYIDRLHFSSNFWLFSCPTSRFVLFYEPITIDELVRTMTSDGLKPDKIVIEVNTFGARWDHVHVTEDYRYTFDNKIARHCEKISLNDIRKGIANNIWQYGYDESAKAPYVFNNQTGVIIFYEDDYSVKAKAKYVMEKGIAGVFISEPSSHDHFIDALNEGLGNKKKDEIVN